MRETWQKRKRRLINPRLQLRLSIVFLCIACSAVLVEGMVLYRSFAKLSTEMGADRDVLLGSLPGIFVKGILLTLLLTIPATLAIGTLTTHRIAGPLYRFGNFLKQVMAGEHSAPCRIRKGDELQELCDTLNEVTEPWRNGTVSRAKEEASSSAPGKAA